MAVMACLGGAVAVRGAVLAHESVQVTGTGGSGGNGTSASDMVFAAYGSDGWGWAGGAGGVQGTGATTATGVSAAAANEVSRFNVGAVADSLNAAYGAGGWTITNPVLTFSTSSKVQNNARFGVGSGTFDVYWVGNDDWAQSKGTLADRGLNPVYADNAADLLAWSGEQSLVGSGAFTVVPGSLDIVTMTVPLSEAASFVDDVVSASAGGSNASASLYLMGTSDSLGMIIYTGGQGAALPALSFDVVSVPEPATMGVLGLGVMAVVRRRRRA
jgi:hypothetical protein